MRTGAAGAGRATPGLRTLNVAAAGVCGLRLALAKLETVLDRQLLEPS